MTRVALVGRSSIFKRLVERLPALDPSLEVVGLPAPDQLDSADVVVGWNLPNGTLAHFPAVKLVHSPAAGCDHLLRDASLSPAVPICRVVDPTQRQGMTTFVTWAVLHYQRQLDVALRNQRERVWKMPLQTPLAKTRVGILGLGQFGGHAASHLAQLGLAVRGWSRSARQLPGVACFHGQAQLGQFLSGLDMLVCLLPLTPQTRGILDLTAFRQLAPGAVVINLGRAEHLVLDDLYAALDQGYLRAALLDVFDKEPLPDDSPLWKDERITVTPHMASAATLDEIVTQLLDNIHRLERGEALVNQIERARGY